LRPQLRLEEGMGRHRQETVGGAGRFGVPGAESARGGAGAGSAGTGGGAAAPARGAGAAGGGASSSGSGAGGAPAAGVGVRRRCRLDQGGARRTSGALRHSPGAVEGGRRDPSVLRRSGRNRRNVGQRRRSREAARVVGLGEGGGRPAGPHHERQGPGRYRLPRGTDRRSATAFSRRLEPAPPREGAACGTVRAAEAGTGAVARLYRRTSGSRLAIWTPRSRSMVEAMTPWPRSRRALTAFSTSWPKIGRASCRARGERSGAGRSA